jgi:hypothetical protein
MIIVFISYILAPSPEKRIKLAWFSKIYQDSVFSGAGVATSPQVCTSTLEV